MFKRLNDTERKKTDMESTIKTENTDILQVMKDRHSVRQYKDKPIEKGLRAEIDQIISDINSESGLKIQAFYDEPKCFDSFMAHYGKFKSVSNYIAIVGAKQDQEKAGYYGEKLVLKCQEMGLNTCWVAMTHGKTKASIGKGEKLLIVLSLGYGETQGVSHKSKSLDELGKADKDEEWFKKGVEAASLAPTAMNQQKFQFELKNGKVTAKAFGGMYTKMDLGIARYHFEAVTGHKVDL